MIPIPPSPIRSRTRNGPICSGSLCGGRCEEANAGEPTGGESIVGWAVESDGLGGGWDIGRRWKWRRARRAHYYWRIDPVQKILAASRGRRAGTALFEASGIGREGSGFQTLSAGTVSAAENVERS